MAVTMNAATIMGNNFQDNQNSIMNTTDLTRCSTSAKLVTEQDEFQVRKRLVGKTVVEKSVINW